MPVVGSGAGTAAIGFASAALGDSGAVTVGTGEVDARAVKTDGIMVAGGELFSRAQPAKADNNSMASTRIKACFFMHNLLRFSRTLIKIEHNTQSC